MNKQNSFAAGTVRHRGGFTLQERQARLAWMMLVPVLVVLVLVALYPLGSTIYASFTDEQFLGSNTKFVGFANYYNILTNNVNAGYPDFFAALVLTLKFSVWSVALEFVGAMLVGGFLGWLIDRWAGSGPWGMIGLLLVGFATGLPLVVRQQKDIDGE